MQGFNRKKWKHLSAPVRHYLLEHCHIIKRFENRYKDSSNCIVELTPTLMVSGILIMIGSEEVLKIDDDAMLYNYEED